MKFLPDKQSNHYSRAILSVVLDKPLSERSRILKEAGDATNKVDTTKIASVYYKGYTIAGETFDTNIKPNDPTAKPFDVNIGTGSVIPGWEIGLKYFGKGGKGTIYVPAMLAYGPQANGAIKPYSNLVFDLEIQDVTKK